MVVSAVGVGWFRWLYFSAGFWVMVLSWPSLAGGCCIFVLYNESLVRLFQKNKIKIR